MTQALLFAAVTTIKQRQLWAKRAGQLVAVFALTTLLLLLLQLGIFGELAMLYKVMGIRRITDQILD